MIFITGDTHGTFDFKKLTIFAEKNQHLTKDDYVIIAGDFAAVWNENTLERDLKIYRDLPFSILFVDGNHENFDLLNNFLVSEFHGGKVHKIKDDIIHLMRGQIYRLEGKTFFTFGGAISDDIITREEHISWWKEEMPSRDELYEAMDNLDKIGNKVDYIITHTCDEKALFYPPLRDPYQPIRAGEDNQMLTYFEMNVDYQHWFFGHFHKDAQITPRKTLLYQKIVQIV